MKRSSSSSILAALDTRRRSMSSQYASPGSFLIFFHAVSRRLMSLSLTGTTVGGFGFEAAFVIEDDGPSTDAIFLIFLPDKSTSCFVRNPILCGEEGGLSSGWKGES